MATEERPGGGWVWARNTSTARMPRYGEGVRFFRSPSPDGLERELQSLLASCDPQQRQEVARAVALMHEGHAGQRRADGEPFWMHPTRVALQLARTGRGSVAGICAALAHDLVEDTPMDLDTVRASLGADVSLLVQWLTVPEHEEQEYYADLPTAPLDARIIKVCDRADNLACLAAMVATDNHHRPWGQSYLRRSRIHVEPLLETVPPMVGRVYPPARRALEDAVAVTDSSLALSAR